MSEKHICDVCKEELPPRPWLSDAVEFRFSKTISIIEAVRGDGKGFAWGIMEREYDPFGEVGSPLYRKSYLCVGDKWEQFGVIKEFDSPQAAWLAAEKATKGNG